MDRLAETAPYDVEAVRRDFPILSRDVYGKPPYRPEEPDGFDAPVLARYNQSVRTLARELHVPLVDVHAAFTGKEPDKLLLDGMHPNDAGHRLIAELLVPVIREQLR